MALYPCPECKKEISDNAKKCPHCGCPQESLREISEESTKGQTSNLLGGGIVAFLVLVLAFIGLSYNDIYAVPWAFGGLFFLSFLYLSNTNFKLLINAGLDGYHPKTLDKFNKIILLFSLLLALAGAGQFMIFKEMENLILSGKKKMKKGEHQKALSDFDKALKKSEEIIPEEKYKSKIQNLIRKCKEKGAKGREGEKE